MSLFKQINKIPDVKLDAMRRDASKFNSISDDNWTGMKRTAEPDVYIQTEEPSEAAVGSLWVDLSNYSRYDKTNITSAAALQVDDNEVILVSGTLTLTLHSAAIAGIIKKIYNIGTGIVTLAGTINGAANMYLYPKESVELITDGNGWRH